MTALDLIPYSLALLVSQFIPGPDFALVTRSSLVYGARYGAYCALGIGVAILFHTTVIGFGGAYLLEQNVTLTKVILGISALWILYLAWKSWPKKGARTEQEEDVVAELPGRSQLFIQAAVTNLLNPKCFLFIASLSTPLLRTGSPSWMPFAIMAIAAGQGVVFWALWSYLLRLGPLERVLTRHKVGLDKFFSILFSCFACYILYLSLFE